MSIYVAIKRIIPTTRTATRSRCKSLRQYEPGYRQPDVFLQLDQYNNLISYCDPNYVWTTHVTGCGAVPGATYYVYNYSTATSPTDRVQRLFADGVRETLVIIQACS